MTKAKPKAPDHSIDCSGPSITQQHFKNECDVNNIVRRYAQTGIDPYELRKQGVRFGRASSQDFTEAMFMVSEVQNQFADLPADIRGKFDNDPAKLLEAYGDPSQADKLTQLGIGDNPIPEDPPEGISEPLEAPPASNEDA